MNTNVILNQSMAVKMIMQTAHQKCVMNQIGHILLAPTVMDRIVDMVQNIFEGCEFIIFSRMS